MQPNITTAEWIWIAIIAIVFGGVALSHFRKPKNIIHISVMDVWLHECADDSDTFVKPLVNLTSAELSQVTCKECRRRYLKLHPA